MLMPALLQRKASVPLDATTFCVAAPAMRNWNGHSNGFRSMTPALAGNRLLSDADG
jgi:hypothetical protein